MSKQTKRTTITFLPAPDVEVMLDRALTNDDGEIPYAATSRYINAALREKLTKLGFARKRDGRKAA